MGPVVLTKARESQWRRMAAIASDAGVNLKDCYQRGKCTAGCIECGECERVCPMDLPLMSLVHKQVRDIDRLFGPYEGGGLSDGGPDPLRTYRTDDVEEFM